MDLGFYFSTDYDDESHMDGLDINGWWTVYMYRHVVLSRFPYCKGNVKLIHSFNDKNVKS